MILEPGAEAIADHLDQRPDADDAVGRDVVSLAGLAVAGDEIGRLGDVVNIDERALRSAAAVELKLAAQADEQDRARDDAVELLARAEYIGGAGEHDREAVIGEISAQAHVGGRPRHRIGRARIERHVLAYEAVGAAVDLGRCHVHVLLQEVERPQPLMQPHGRDHVGHEPVVGILPALGDHALRREVHDIRRTLLLDQRRDGVEIAIEVEGEEAKVVRSAGPTVRQERRMRLRRPADFRSPRRLGRSAGRRNSRRKTSCCRAPGIWRWYSSTSCSRRLAFDQ